MIKHSIPKRNVAYDATGAGNYLKNYLPGSYAFHSGAKAIMRVSKKKANESKEFEHLKTQCYYLLAQEIMSDNSRFMIFDNHFKDQIIEEILCIKTLPKDKIDSIIKMVPKSDIVKILGHSPDILDAIAMRMVWEVKQKYKRNF